MVPPTNSTATNSGANGNRRLDPASDIRDHGLTVRLLPSALKPYARLARLDRPIGTWLLLFPCWWSLALAGDPRSLAAGGPWSIAWLALLFGLGALVMRGAGCTYNDIVDRDLDARVARTRSRPIPAGDVSVRQAAGFLVFQILIGFLILISLRPLAIALGVGSLVLIAAYPFMKRITDWPQLWLGLTFNWGALLAYAAVTGDLGWPAVFLYLGGIAWTLGYDTIYAHQDKEDDALIGVRSSARALGARTRPFLYATYAAMIALIGLAGASAGLAWPFYAGLAVAGAHLLWQAARVALDDPGHCLAVFRSNRITGWLVLAALVGGRVFA
ncbi:MAG: 4-hydroxybenzoate octaprenyltransferase [Alphaproteobacteria bacterium]